MMKNAKYYIDLIFQDGDHSDDEWKRIDKEVAEWIENCPEAERDEFAKSGAGEMLYMTCTAIELNESRETDYRSTQ